MMHDNLTAAKKGGTVPQVPPDFKIYLYDSATSTKYVEILAIGALPKSYGSATYDPQTEYFFSGNGIPSASSLKLNGNAIASPTLTFQFYHYPRVSPWSSGKYEGAGAGYTTKIWSFVDPIEARTLYLVCDYSGDVLAKLSWVKTATSTPSELWPSPPANFSFDQPLTLVSALPKTPPAGSSFYHITLP
jgi:hypothetical protein